MSIAVASGFNYILAAVIARALFARALFVPQRSANLTALHHTKNATLTLATTIITVQTTAHIIVAGVKSLDV